MTAKRGGLGKGLDSLIKENKTAKHTAPVKKEVVNAGPIMMKINDVEPNRDQPRKHFEEDALLDGSMPKRPDGGACSHIVY